MDPIDFYMIFFCRLHTVEFIHGWTIPLSFKLVNNEQGRTQRVFWTEQIIIIFFFPQEGVLSPTHTQMSEWGMEWLEELCTWDFWAQIAVHFTCIFQNYVYMDFFSWIIFYDFCHFLLIGIGKIKLLWKKKGGIASGKQTGRIWTCMRDSARCVRTLEHLH